jgi:hypothetical protein
VRESSVTPLAQVQITIRRKLAQAAQTRDVEAFLDKLRKSTRVETFPENLAKVKPAPRSVAERRAEKPGTDRVSSLVP